MALRNLVDAQCGEGNALLRLTQHVTQDKALLDEGLRWSRADPPAEGTVFNRAPIEWGMHTVAKKCAEAYEVLCL